MANALNSSKKPCRGGKTTWSQRSAIVVFLEDPTNFNLITGNATANLHGVVARAKSNESKVMRTSEMLLMQNVALIGLLQWLKGGTELI